MGNFVQWLRLAPVVFLEVLVIINGICKQNDVQYSIVDHTRRAIHLLCEICGGQMSYLREPTSHTFHQIIKFLFPRHPKSKIKGNRSKAPPLLSKIKIIFIKTPPLFSQIKIIWPKHLHMYYQKLQLLYFCDSKVIKLFIYLLK